MLTKYFRTTTFIQIVNVLDIHFQTQRFESSTYVIMSQMVTGQTVLLPTYRKSHVASQFPYLRWLWTTLKVKAMHISGHPAKPGKYYQQKIQNFNKMAACSYQCPLWQEHRHWGFDIPGYNFGSSIYARAIPPTSWALLPRWLQTVYRVFNGRPHLHLYKKTFKFTT